MDLANWAQLNATPVLSFDFSQLILVQCPDNKLMSAHNYIELEYCFLSICLISNVTFEVKPVHLTTIVGNSIR